MDPLKSVIELIDDFLTKIDNINNLNNSLNTDTYSIKHATNEARQLKIYITSYAQNPTSSNIEKSLSMLHSIELLTDNWLSANSNIKPMIIKSINAALKEIETLLCYQQHKTTLKDFAQSEVITNFTATDAKE
jgi:hypothetical protein